MSRPLNLFVGAQVVALLPCLLPCIAAATNAATLESEDREVVTVPGWPALKGFPLSFAIKTKGMVYASGITGMDMKTFKKVSGGIAAETTKALSNLQELLVAAGSSLDDVMACSVSLADIKRDFPAMNGAYAPFFPHDPPSRVAVQVGKLAGDASVEIQCTATVKGSDRQVVAMPGMPHMHVPLSIATKTGGIIYLSGMQGMDMKTMKLVSGGAAAETTQTLENIDTVLGIAGSKSDHILSCEVSLTNISDFKAVNTAYEAFFKSKAATFPSRVAAQVGGLAGAASVEIRCLAAEMSLTPKVVNVPGWPTLPFPFSTAIEQKGMLYISGMQGFDMKTMKLVPGGVGPETSQTLQNVAETVKSAGMRIEDVVECEVSLTDMGNFQTMNAAYAKFWPTAPPARVAVQVGKLAGTGVVEIKCIGTRPGSKNTAGTPVVV